jgi:putative FmdB family regulatory protein
MPIYEYKCKNCGKITEFLEGVGQGNVDKVCKHCGSKQLEKIFSKSNIRMGGTTCCGRTERCDKPPCSDDEICKR